MVHPVSVLRVLSFAGVALALAACSSKKPEDHALNCEKKFSELHAKFEKGHYQTARDGYATFLTSCTGFEFTEQALFEQAESYFRMGDYIESESEYRVFLKEYPNSRRFGEEARYRVAQSMAKQVGIAARDQSKTLEAIAAYEDFLVEFGEAKFADSAKAEIDKMRNLLAEKEEQIAKLYRRMGEPLAAAIYYKNLLKQYGDRVNQRDITLKLTRCYIDLNQFDEAEGYLRKFEGIAKDDPFKIEVKAAYDALEKARQRHAREKREEKEESQRREAL
jgi:outer membrane protein assembly factor BamD